MYVHVYTVLVHVHVRVALYSIHGHVRMYIHFVYVCTVPVLSVCVLDHVIKLSMHTGVY